MVRLAIIGLDCAEPSLVFERWRADLPTFARLMARGVYGRMESSIPAITVPAWSCMMSGRDPGELGIYGFRNRRDRDYGSMSIANGLAVKQPRLWDFLGDAGWRVSVLGVPGTYPPPPVNGSLVSCFLAPNTEVTYTHPPELATQIQSWVGEYLLDVPNFRSDDKVRILADLHRMCDQQFDVAEQLLKTEQPDFAMFVDMGVDRIHHAFWRYMDPIHPLHEPGSPFENAIHDYYCHVDRRLAKYLTLLDDDTVILVISDHGARALQGGFCLNEWLRQEGYLSLAETPSEPTALDAVTVNWPQTRAWGAGGYYGRIFLNVQGREPQGTISPRDYETVRAELIGKLEALNDPLGQSLNVKVYKPQQIYQSVRGIAPDLIAYFGELAWRSVGSVGMDSLYTVTNDTGPDDANHAQYGMYIYVDPQPAKPPTPIQDISIYDVVPSLLSRFGLSSPPKLRGRAVFGSK